MSAWTTARANGSDAKLEDFLLRWDVPRRTVEEQDDLNAKILLGYFERIADTQSKAKQDKDPARGQS